MHDHARRESVSPKPPGGAGRRRGNPDASAAPRSSLRVVAVGSLLLLLIGCTEPAPTRGQCVGFYLAPGAPLQCIGRVAFVELRDPLRAPETSAQFTDAIARALRDRRLFSLRVVHADQPECEGLPLSSPEGLSLADMGRIARQLHCDAVLFGTLSDFQPYPHMRAGLLLHLVDLRNGSLAWGVDHVWDTQDRAVIGRIQRFHETEQREGYGPAEWEMSLLSPRAFQRFVAHEVAGTLPPAPPCPTDDPVAGE